MRRRRPLRGDEKQRSTHARHLTHATQSHLIGQIKACSACAVAIDVDFAGTGYRKWEIVECVSGSGRNIVKRSGVCVCVWSFAVRLTWSPVNRAGKCDLRTNDTHSTVGYAAHYRQCLAPSSLSVRLSSSQFSGVCCARTPVGTLCITEMRARTRTHNPFALFVGVSLCFVINLIFRHEMGFGVGFDSSMCAVCAQTTFRNCG